MTPPAIEKPTAGELWNLGKLGLAFRGLGKKDAFRLLRWGPMAVADLVAEYFETELLRATIAAGGSAKYLEGFGPPMDGFDQVTLGDLDALVRLHVRPERARVTPFACPDVGPGVIAMTLTAVV